MTGTCTSKSAHAASPSSAWRRCAVAAVAALTLLAAAAAQATPTGTLDQQQTDGSGGAFFFGQFGGDSSTLAQTFTAGLSGVLDQVDLRLGDMTGPATVEIHTVDDTGAPGSAVLASTSVAPVTDYTWVEAAFSSPATVVAGTKYAIVVRPAGRAGWNDSAVGDPYPAGEPYRSVESSPWGALDSDRDFTFKTYVTVPPPAADLSLSIAGPATAKSKAQVTYILTVRNKGPQAAPNVVLTDYLPYGTQFTSVGTSQGSCTVPGKGGSGKVTCNLGDIASGADSTSGVTL
jgi:uncharacterized repeat protein (TIGR01451 family)